METKKCICFARVSTAIQDLEQQTEELYREAERNGYTKDKVILIENKESAVKLDEEERIGIQQLKHTIENDNIEVVFIYEISRLSRRPNVLYSVRDYLIDHKVNLVCIKPYMRLLENDGTLSQTASILFSLFGAMSENEGYIRKARLKRGKDKGKAEGKLMNGTPLYGYEINKDKTLSIVEKEAAVIHEIFDRYCAGETGGVIGQDLWLRGVLHAKKLISAKNFVNETVKNENYCGNILYPQIIDIEQFKQCEALRNRTSELYKLGKIRRNNCTFLCSKMLYTEEGYILSPKKSINMYGKTSDNETSKICVNMEYTDRLVTYALNQYIHTYNINENEREQERQELNTRKSNNILKINEIERKVEELDKENDRINIRIIKGKLSEDKGDKLIDENNKQKISYADLTEDLKHQNYNIDNRLIYLNSFLFEQDVETLGKNVEDIKRVLLKYCNKIIVSREKFGTYTFKFLWKDGKEEQYKMKSVSKRLRYYKIKDNKQTIINI